MKNNIVIRKMDMSDVPYVYKEELKIFGKSLGEETLYHEVLHNKLSKYFMAFVDNKRAGYVGSWLTVPNAEILNLFVSEDYRGNNIGKLLMGEVIRVCTEEKIELLTLEVRPSNKYAITMYEELGFVESHRRKNYYANNEDAILMVLKIEVIT
mgnify:FL=1